MKTPTDAQTRDAERVQKQMLSEASLLSNEGVGPHAMIAGMGAAVADIISTAWGPRMVSRWFANQAAMLEAMQSGREH